jgi:bacillolysin/thermolysin
VYSPPVLIQPGGVPPADPSLAKYAGDVKIWQYQNGEQVPMDPAQLPTGNDQVALVAFQNAERVEQFFKEKLNRNGWDNKGAPLQIVVHTPNDQGGPLNNAFWDKGTSKIYIGDGDGKIFAPLGGALDVLTHESTHAIVDSEVHLPYKGQSGAINESWADVMGCLNDPDKDWRVGEDVFTPAVPGDQIRDLANPRFSSLKQIPPGADVEVHDLSGIPSLAAVKVADRIGRDQMGKIWYTALVNDLKPMSGFSGAARATLEAATSLYGAGSDQLAAVQDAWKAVGVDPHLKTA